MGNKRVQERLPLAEWGRGLITASGDAFSFEVRNFTVSGLQMQVTQGSEPGFGEEVLLAFAMEKYGGGNMALTVTGNVRRIDAHPDGAMCGVKVEEVRTEGEEAPLDAAYLERYFDLHG